MLMQSMRWPAARRVLMGVTRAPPNAWQTVALLFASLLLLFTVTQPLHERHWERLTSRTAFSRDDQDSHLPPLLRSLFVCVSMKYSVQSLAYLKLVSLTHTPMCLLKSQTAH